MGKPKTANNSDRRRLIESIVADTPVRTVPPGMSGEEYLRLETARTGSIDVSNVGIDFDGALRMREIRARVDLANQVITERAPTIVQQRKRAAAMREIRGNGRTPQQDAELAQMIKLKPDDETITPFHRRVHAKGIPIERAQLHRLVKQSTWPRGRLS